MRKLLYILIFVLIIINFFLFYIDKPYSDKYEKYNLLLINENSENEKTKSSDDDFEKIDSAFLGKNFNKKWIYTKKTDSLWYKYIKVPNTYDLARYNLFFQKILRINDIKIQKAEEYELSNKIVFTFAAGDTIPARVELRITQGLESDISLSGSVSVIITGMGNNWGQEWIKNLLESEKPMTISILPDRWATNKIYSEAVNNAKEVIISLPMEPEIGNIDKEKLKILKGMNNFTVDIILDKALAELPKAIGIINYRGERVISDYETMDIFLKSLKKRNLIYIENCTGVDSYSQILCGEYNIPSGYPMKYFENLKDLENDFKIVSENVINGEDAIIVIEASEENCKFIINEMVKEDTEINYLPLSQLVGLIK